MAEAPPSPSTLAYWNAASHCDDDSSDNTWPSDPSHYWSDEDDLDIPRPYLSPSPPPAPSTSDSVREDYVNTEEKCLEADAYAGPIKYTVNDWWLFSEQARDYATYVSERRPPPTPSPHRSA